MTREAMEREVDRWHRYARNWERVWFAAIGTSVLAVFSSFFVPNPFAPMLNLASMALTCVAWYAMAKARKMQTEADKAQDAMGAGGDW